MELVTDTNVWIDLYRGGLLAHAWRLPHVWIVPDVVLAEIIEPDGEIIGATVSQHGSVISLTGAEVLEAGELSQKYPRISRVDSFAFSLAKCRKQTLLTGDGEMRKAAPLENVDVHGTIWVMDGMVDEEAVSTKMARGALEEMLRHGSRLPKSEVSKRLERWSKAG